MKVTITSHSPAPRPFLSALISGAAGLLGQEINAISQAATNRQQIKASKEMQQQQHENALAQMEVSQLYSQDNMKLADAYNQAAEQRANEYNSMGAQMHRADQAGVSRIAALGQSTGQTISQMNAPSSSPAGAVGGSPGSLRAPMFDFTGLSRAVAEIENIKSDTKLKDQDARLRSYQADEAEFQKRMQPVRQAILENARDKSDAEAKLAKLDALRKEIFVGENGENAQREYDAFITKLENEGTMTQAQADAYRAEGNLKEEQAKTEGAKRAKLAEETKYQKRLNRDYEDYGFTPNSSQYGLIAGISRRIAETVTPGASHSEEGKAQFKEIQEFIRSQIRDSIGGRFIADVGNIYRWITDKYSNLSPKSKDVIYDILLKNFGD